ncbi:uracil-DNA glycosylase [Candidatus Termititenax persephonae]|uniref:Type-4 uracil-DNA glycosylase n=1 Tax=Candidatus Termititenax persephonae TaxID=2218525 RepID=A0A388TF80_9BACT|nr:uracil-DNA glycosylase [Candidatus Termititenax persephonae]
MSEYEELRAACLQCTACALAEKRRQVVFGVGPVPCDLMLIGEAPGADEDEQGIPFVGRAGQLLTKMLSSVNINREADIYIANICKCRPPENRNPEPEEANACKHWLQDQIRLVQPRIMVLAGSVAMRNMLGEEMPGITKARGQWTVCEGIDTLIIFHPSYLLRNASSAVGSPKWLTWQDLRAVKSALEYKKLEGQES